MMGFEAALRELINMHSQENASNTPDFILAQYMMACLAAWNTGVQQRETWYGRDARPSTRWEGAASEKPLADSTDRCEVCDWPLAADREHGCVRGDCAYRPPDGSDEWKRIRAKRDEIAAKGGTSA